jgi:hypothetical protein
MSLDVARHWRQRGARYRLEGQRNRVTGELRFPPRPPAVGEAPDAWESVFLSGRGEIYSFSVIRQAPAGYEDLTPYPVALVRLAEGPLVTAQLTDCSEDELTIGQQVELVTRRIADTGPDGVLVYGYKFRPVLG